MKMNFYVLFHFQLFHFQFFCVLDLLRRILGTLVVFELILAETTIWATRSCQREF